MTSATARPWRAGGLLTGVLVAAVLAVAWAARASEGRSAVEACDAAIARGDPVEAIARARAAAEARCPLCSAPELGYDRLGAIAKAAEARGDAAAAVAAWRAQRAAALGTAALDTSPARREQADAELARLEHRVDAASASPSPAATEERLRAALAARAVPSGTVFVLVAVGAALFLAGGIRLARAPALRPTELAVALAGGALVVAALLLF